MKVTTVEHGLPIKSWCSEPEEGTIEQARHLALLPFAFKHIALMPDAHQGYGMPIGGVLATEAVVIPNAVGKDIGCGMCAVRLHRSEIEVDELKRLLSEIRNQIPLGFNNHKSPQDDSYMPHLPLPAGGIVQREYAHARCAVGTLGGGNHFIEIQKGDDGSIWLMLHSGSRNLGLQVADHYNKIAIELNTRWHSAVPKEHQLAFLPLDTDIAQNYMQEMQYCVEFALANRHLMVQRILQILGCGHDEIINIAHNYAVEEEHFGHKVMVHRKGATLATKQTVGIIPGSQGSSSYIVKGLGHRDSFHSCSHGAGRKIGRKEAMRSLNLQTEMDALDQKGIIHAIRNVSDLDEAPGAYKDIDVVMAEQKELVEVVVQLQPMAVIKG